MTVPETVRGKGVSFERIRRITGYLCTLDRFGNGKSAEENDRIKHIKFMGDNMMNNSIFNERPAYPIDYEHEAPPEAWEYEEFDEFDDGSVQLGFRDLPIDYEHVAPPTEIIVI